MIYWGGKRYSWTRNDATRLEILTNKWQTVWQGCEATKTIWTTQGKPVKSVADWRIYALFFFSSTLRVSNSCVHLSQKVHYQLDFSVGTPTSKHIHEQTIHPVSSLSSLLVEIMVDKFTCSAIYCSPFWVGQANRISFLTSKHCTDNQ